MATRTISNAGGNWNTVGCWVEGAIPLSSDDVVATGTSGNVTFNSNVVCLTIDLTGYIGSITRQINGARTITVSGNTVVFSSGMTWIDPFGDPLIILTSTGSVSITSNGCIGPPLQFNGTGTYTLQDTYSTTGEIRLTKGTFNTNAKTLNCFLFDTTGSNATTLTITNSTINVDIFGTDILATLNVTGSTIVLKNLYNSSNYIDSDKTFNNVTILGGTGTELDIPSGLILTGNLTISGPKLLVIGFGTTISIGGTITLNTSSSSVITFESDTPGSQWNISKTSGTQTFNWLNLTDSNATGGATWIANSSIDGGNNTGWTITAPILKKVIGGLLPIHAKSILNIMLNTFKPGFIQNRKI